MKIEFNTGHNIQGGQKLSEPLVAEVNEKLGRFDDQLTRIIIHLTDEDGDKDGQNDIKCVLEARPRGMQAVVVTHKAKTHENSVGGAIDKLKASLDSVLGKLSNH